MVDSVTKERDRLSYPKVLIEARMDQHFPGFIEFENEHGFNIQVGIKYEWKPVIYTHFSGLGHKVEECRKNNKGKQEWIVKEDKRLSVKKIDEDGFMEVSKGSKATARKGTTEAVIVENAFRVLNMHNKLQNYEVGVVGDQSEEVDFVSLLETRVKAPKLGNLYSNVFAGWCFSSNIAWHAGGKIVIAWNPLRFIVDIIRCTSQLMHLKVITIDGIFDSYLKVIYASNNRNERRELWKDVIELNPKGRWCMMGDFNEILSKEERIGNRVRSSPGEEFLNCVNQCQMEDVKYSGNFFTWSNKQHGEDRIYSKIDIILANQAWLTFL
ncbi:hypothetical protein CsatA_007147 [Cannabis sativa]